MADANYKVAIKVNSEADDSGIKQSGTSLDAWAGKAAAAATAAAAVGVVIKQAFDLSQEGANIIQTQQSFDRLVTSFGLSPSIIDEMSDAVRGTVTELDLMSSTMTLTAGLSQEMGESFVGNVPQLLEIAKAANKLNPSLGSTAFLFDSLATGIKRGSPLLIDNTGIVIKSAEANEAMAASLGKTVEELTGAEKQQATYNAVLAAGQPLIDSVGGSVDSGADAWARLTVNIEEQEAVFKTWFAEGILPTIQILNGDYQDAMQKAVEANIAVAKSQSDLVDDFIQYEDRVGRFSSILTGANDDAQRGARLAAVALLEEADSADELSRILAESGVGARTFQTYLTDITTEYKAVHGTGIPTLQDLKTWVDRNNEALGADVVLLQSVTTGYEDIAEAQEAVIDTTAIHAQQLAEAETLNARAIEVQQAQAEGAMMMMEQRAEQLADLATQREREHEERRTMVAENRKRLHAEQLEMIEAEEEAQRSANAAFVSTALDALPMVEDAMMSIEQQLLKMAVAQGNLSPEQFVELSQAAGIGDAEIATGLQDAFRKQALQQAAAGLGAGGDVGSILQSLQDADSMIAQQETGLMRGGSYQGGVLTETVSPILEDPAALLSRLQSLFGTLSINVDARGASDPLAVQDAAYAGANAAIDAAMAQAGQTANELRRTQ